LLVRLEGDGENADFMLELWLRFSMVLTRCLIASCTDEGPSHSDKISIGCEIGTGDFFKIRCGTVATGLTGD
jgi:hypothetical protein